MSNSDTQAPIADKARGFAPVVWLLGKVQSGKTSIIRELTQAGSAEIGSGFRACTRTARVFDFPSEAPIIRFLDTRGLGEVAYDPTEDIGFCEGRSHLILAVVKVLDLEQQAVLDVIRAAKKRHPEWPVVVAQTSLHEGYAPGQRHALPYPFGPTPAAGVPAGPAGSCARASARPVSGSSRRGCNDLRADRLHASRRRLRAHRLRPRCPDRRADRGGAGSRGRRPGRAAEPAQRQRRPQGQCAHLRVRAGRRCERCLSPRRRRGRAGGAGGHAPATGEALRRALGQAGLCGVRRRARRRHAGAGRLHLRRAPARQADPGLRTDGRCGSGGSRELRRDLRHGQGRQLFPGDAPARESERRDRVRLSGSAAGGFHVAKERDLGSGATGARP